MPIDTSIRQFDKNLSAKGLHVLDLFSGISCGGLRTVLEARVSCYTSVEIDDISRVIARRTLNDLHDEYPGQLPDSAIRGYSKSVPQDIRLIKPVDISNLIEAKGPVQSLCGG